MPGSTTTPGHMGTRAVAPICVAFQQCNGVGSRDKQSFAAQWLAYALPYRRFARTLASTGARLGADVVRYSFIVRDSHPLLLAGLSGRDCIYPFLPLSRRPSPQHHWVG
jgi:hypothetical protein